MDQLFNLRSDLSPSAPADEDDVNLTKHFLADTGDFEVPDYGITRYPDAPLFEAIANFQGRNKLATDGIMRASGPTEGALDQHLRETRWKPVERLRTELDRRCRGLAPAIFIPNLPSDPDACKRIEDKCWMQLQIDLLECSRIAGGNRRIFKICESSAMERYGNCLAGRPLGPLYRGE